MKGLDCLQYGPIEKNKALAIVSVILASGAINAVAVEVASLTDQIDQDTGARKPAFVDLPLDPAGANGNTKDETRIDQLRTRRPDSAVTRYEQDRGMALFLQG